MEIVTPYLSQLAAFVDSSRTEIVIVLVGLLIWFRLGMISKAIREQQEKTLSKAELFISAEQALHERIEQILKEIRTQKP